MDNAEIPTGKYIQLVQCMIERCLERRMNQEQTVQRLLREGVDPSITIIVWRRLEDHNVRFFTRYYVILLLDRHVTEFRELRNLLNERRHNMRSTRVDDRSGVTDPDGITEDASVSSARNSNK